MRTNYNKTVSMPKMRSSGDRWGDVNLRNAVQLHVTKRVSWSILSIYCHNLKTINQSYFWHHLHCAEVYT